MKGEQVACSYTQQYALHESYVVIGPTACQPQDSMNSPLARGPVCRFGRCLTVAWLFVLSATSLCGQKSFATEVDFPIVEPFHTIYVEAETVAKEVRGAYDVLAFEGTCKLRQGELNAAADKVVLWIERRDTDGIKLPGKIICYLDGRATVAWNDERRLRDERWMGRLFSLHPVDYRVQREVNRNDIPQLDWNNGFGSSVQPAQYTQAPLTNVNGGNVLAPPLLGVPATGADASRLNGVEANAGILPGPSSVNVLSVPPVAGAVPWIPNGGTNNSELIPRAGLVIPED